MVKIELDENRRLQVGPTGNVVLVSCGEGEEANIITVGMYMPISSRPPLVCIGIDLNAIVTNLLRKLENS